MEAGELGAEAGHLPHSEFEAILGCIETRTQKQKGEKKENESLELSIYYFRAVLANT